MFLKTTDQVYAHLRATKYILHYIAELYLKTLLTYYQEEVKKYTSPFSIVPVISKASVQSTSSIPHYIRKSSLITFVGGKDSSQKLPHDGTKSTAVFQKEKVVTLQ